MTAHMRAETGVDTSTFEPTEAFSREVQITREEFLRQLPDAIGNRAFDRDGDIFTIDEGSGRVSIRLRQQADKELGELDLPMMRIDFAFEDMSEQEIRSFMETYDTNTLRGSGGM